MRRSLAGVQILVRLGKEYGLSPDQCLVNSGVSVADLASPAVTIVIKQELTIIRNLQDQLGRDRGFGLATPIRWAR